MAKDVKNRIIGIVNEIADVLIKHEVTQQEAVYVLDNLKLDILLENFATQEYGDEPKKTSKSDTKNS
jgi:uncharacterized protein YejL (UPF0352 family)